MLLDRAEKRAGEPLASSGIAHEHAFELRGPVAAAHERGHSEGDTVGASHENRDFWRFKFGHIEHVAAVGRVELEGRSIARGEKRLDVGLPRGRLPVLWACAIAAGLAAFGLKSALTAKFGPSPGALLEWGGHFSPPPDLPPLLVAAACIAIFGAVYGLLAAALKVPQAQAMLRKVLRKTG